MRKKKNCWELHLCGRQLGGEKSEKLGVCPASTETRLHGANRGTNAGRACWVIAGTFGKDRPRCSCPDATTTCASCRFYNRVRDEEGARYEVSLILLNRLRGPR